jgi:hypothetical protein
MRKNYEYLSDSSFMKLIDTMKNKEQYVKITLLDFLENPIQSIEGKVLGGSINLDGTSTVRRTCNLTMVADEFENDLTNVNNLISINKKLDLEVGFLNTTGQYTKYKIIWIPLGTYVIITPSISHTTSGVTISLQLKDKMCLLNGECGGVIPASTTFHQYETVNENGEYVIVQPTIFQIIQELVNHFGGEQLGKIIISDLDTRVKKVMKWVGSSPLYIIEKISGGSVQYTPTTNGEEAAAAATYKMYSYGEDIGYVYTDFIYTDELIADAGNTVCDILDKIKSALGNYEYFYDIDGNFVFQEIKNYLNTSHSTVELEKLKQEDYVADYSKGKAVYVFDDSTLITSYTNSPQYNMIKNDFIVWGIRESSDGLTYPIRYHLAIDKKPTVGNTYKVFFYYDEEDYLTKAKCPTVFNTMADFPTVGVQEVFYMDKSTNKIYEWDTSSKSYNEINVELKDIKTKDWRTELYLSGSVAEPLGMDSNYYYTELKNEWPKLYDTERGEYYEEVLKYPSGIDFYLDLIDSDAAVSSISVSNIGRRTKVINDNDINCIFEPEIPNLILLNQADENIAELRKECENKGQDYIQLSQNLFSLIANGGTFNSAYEAVKQLLYQYTSYNESITINAIPIFYLEPNTRITVRDPISGIYGDYMINTISLPLDITSTMTLSCSRALERI